MNLVVERLSDCSSQDIADLARLTAQLSATAPPLTAEHIRTMLAAPGTTVLVARAPDTTIVGTATVTVLFLPSGVKARIDDVVVEDAWRGQGVGTTLSRAAVAVARAADARYVDLTSASFRTAGHRIYEGLGFARRDTQAYRLHLAAEGNT